MRLNSSVVTLRAVFVVSFMKTIVHPTGLEKYPFRMLLLPFESREPCTGGAGSLGQLQGLVPERGCRRDQDGWLIDDA
jgi:hypothetical protein